MQLLPITGTGFPTPGYGIDVAGTLVSVDPTEIRLDEWAAPTTAVQMGGQKLSALGAPLVGTDAARLIDVPLPSALAPLVNGVASAGASSSWSRGDHVHPTDSSRAPVASPTFTGSPAAPTPATADSSTLLATTAFVKAVAASKTYLPSAIAYEDEANTFTSSNTFAALTLTGVLSSNVDSGAIRFGAGHAKASQHEIIQVHNATDGQDWSLYRPASTRDLSFYSALAGDALKLTQAGQLQLATSGATGGLLITGDTNLYRSGPDALKTDDRFETATGLRAMGHPFPASGTGIEMYYESSGTPEGAVLAYDRTGGAYKKLALYGSSIVAAPSGTEVARFDATGLLFTDTYLSRGGAGYLGIQPSGTGGAGLQLRATSGQVPFVDFVKAGGLKWEIGVDAHYGTDSLYFYEGVTPAYRMGLTSAGNLVISSGNINRPDNAGVAFQVGNGTNTSFGDTKVRNAAGSADRFEITDTGSAYFTNDVWHNSIEGKGRFYFSTNNLTYFKSGHTGTTQFQFRDSADTNIANINSAGTYTATSDAALKFAFTEPLGVLERLRDLPVRNYRLKNDPAELQIGVTSQDFYRAFPELQLKQNRELGAPQGISYGDQIGVLQAAVRALLGRVEQLEGAIA